MYTYYTKEGKFETYLYENIPFNKLNREDGPAVIYPNGHKQWRINGERHRENGPAVEQSNGTKEWWVNGKRHRLDSPAIERPNGSKEWYVNGRGHKLDGPAVIWSNGDKEWWVNGKKLNKNKVEKWIKNNNINLKTKKHQALFMLRFG